MLDLEASNVLRDMKNSAVYVRERSSVADKLLGHKTLHAAEA
jgi:hypothetical protein